MSLYKEATNRPKKPINVYFTFRSEWLATYKDEENKINKINQDWKNIDPKLKKEMESKYKE